MDGLTKIAGLSDHFTAGDVVSFGAHWSVPPDLVGKYFRVLAVGREVRLSKPYKDAACTTRYHPVDPRTRQ